MSEVNVQISVTNLTQMDRYQTDTHRGPMVNQEQNADAARNEAARRMEAPVEPDRIDGKKIDPEARREEERKKKKKKRPDENAARVNQARTSSGRGRVVDFEA